MLRLVLAALCALVCAYNVAWAEGGKQCASITSLNDPDCARLPRVNVGRDHRVEIFTRQRSIFFPVPQGEDGDELRLICTDGKCECAEHVQFFEFKGPHRGFRAVNDLERSAANKTHCSLENAYVNRDALAFAVSAHLLSTAIAQLEYCHGCGGSCHGSTKLATYNADTGQALRVREILKPGTIDALRRHMIDFMVANYGSEEGRAGLRQRLTEDLSHHALSDQGVYAERGTLYVDLDSFALSCADGSFYPIPVPRDLIAPTVAALLN